MAMSKQFTWSNLTHPIGFGAALRWTLFSAATAATIELVQRSTNKPSAYLQALNFVPQISPRTAFSQFRQLLAADAILPTVRVAQCFKIIFNPNHYEHFLQHQLTPALNLSDSVSALPDQNLFTKETTTV